MQNSKVRNTLILLYILAVLGFSASARAAMEHFPIVKNSPMAFQAKTLMGEVALAVDGRAYLIVSETHVYELRNHEEELASFNGKHVVVTGYELMHKVGPVYQLSSFDPLSDGEPERTVAPVLVVLQISEIAE